MNKLILICISFTFCLLLFGQNDSTSWRLCGLTTGAGKGQKVFTFTRTKNYNEKKITVANITYTQAGVSVLRRKEICNFEVRHLEKGWCAKLCKVHLQTISHN